MEDYYLIIEYGDLKFIAFYIFAFFLINILIIYDIFNEI